MPILFAALLSSGAGVSCVAQDATLPVDKHDAADIALPEESHGQHAIDLLGSKLPEVAARNGMTPEQLRSALLNNQTLWVDRRGRLLFKDTFVPKMEESSDSKNK